MLALFHWEFWEPKITGAAAGLPPYAVAVAPAALTATVAT